MLPLLGKDRIIRRLKMALELSPGWGRNAQAAIARHNVQINEANARAVEIKGRLDQVEFQRMARAAWGKAKASFGARGARVDVGAPDIALADMAAEAQYQSSLIGYKSTLEAQNFRARGAVLGAQSEIYKTAGENAMDAGSIGAGSAMLGGFARMGEAGYFEGVPLLGKAWGGGSSSSSGQSVYPAH